MVQSSSNVDMSHFKKQDMFCKYFTSTGVQLEAMAMAMGQHKCAGPGSLSAVVGSFCFLKRSQGAKAAALPFKLQHRHHLTAPRPKALFQFERLLAFAPPSESSKEAKNNYMCKM